MQDTESDTVEIESEEESAIFDLDAEEDVPEEKQAEEKIVEQEDVEIPQDLALDFEEIENEILQDESTDDADNSIEEESDSDKDSVLPLENQDSELGEFNELEEQDINEDDILVELNDNDELTDEIVENADEISDSPEEIDKDIVEDVDKVFTTMKDENISDSDLDFIDTLNDLDSDDNLVSEDEFFNQNDAETLQELASDEEEGFLEPLEEISDSSVSDDEQNDKILEKRESSTPIVPIYDAEIPEEDMVMSDEIEQGDTVLHAKYGSGVVEKMIKYGNKNLYSINFDNVGRRLLDPTLTEIKKA